MQYVFGGIAVILLLIGTLAFVVTMQSRVAIIFGFLGFWAAVFSIVLLCWPASSPFLHRSEEKDSVASMLEEKGVVVTPKMEKDIEALRDNDFTRLNSTWAIERVGDKYFLWALNDKIRNE